MFIPFENLPDDSRLWVYQANQTISDELKEIIEKQLTKNIESWSAHGVYLAGSFCVISNRFVIIAVNESYHSPSGCSIDASTHWLKELGNQLNIDFFDRSVVYTNNDELLSFQPFTAKKQIELGIINANSPIFDNLIKTVSELKTTFTKPANETWMKRFFVENKVSI